MKPQQKWIQMPRWQCCIEATQCTRCGFLPTGEKSSKPMNLRATAMTGRFEIENREA